MHFLRFKIAYKVLYTSWTGWELSHLLCLSEEPAVWPWASCTRNCRWERKVVETTHSQTLHSWPSRAVFPFISKTCHPFCLSLDPNKHIPQLLCAAFVSLSIDDILLTWVTSWQLLENCRKQPLPLLYQTEEPSKEPMAAELRSLS